MIFQKASIWLAH